MAAGILVANAAQSVAGGAWSTIFGAADRASPACFRMHLHGAVFRPVPELGGASTLDEEIQHVARQGELAGVAHLLPNTRLRSALFGVCLL